VSDRMCRGQTARLNEPATAEATLPERHNASPTVPSPVGEGWPQGGVRSLWLPSPAHGGGAGGGGSTNMDNMEDDDEHRWPDDLLDAAAVRAWIAAVLPGTREVAGPLYVHQAKEWGVTASFAASNDAGVREVIFKAGLLRLFADAPRIAALLTRVCPNAVPQLLAWEPHGEGSWSLFATFEGQSIEELENQQALQQMARTLAHIQATVAALPQEERAPLPRLALRLLPRLYETVLREVRERSLAYWADEGRELAEQFNLPADILAQMERFQPHIAAWTDELVAGSWPESLDHVDLHAGNAILRSDGGILIYDWEEANLSCPFFSLDRLLDDARDLESLESSESPDESQAQPTATPGGIPYTPAERALRDAYLAALPWGTPASRERAFDLALCLAPIKTAYESVILAETLGWEEGSPHLIAWALGRALPRWRALSPQAAGG